jgi:uncharacterized protein (UPF0332 family)
VRWYDGCMPDDPLLYLRKALESLAGADSEFANGRYNNCANRCYYACFQAAIAALIRDDIRPPRTNGEWSHDFVRAQVDGVLIHRRKRLPPALRGTLHRDLSLRLTGDYAGDDVSRTEAERAVRRCRYFVEAVQEGGGSFR